MQNPYEFDCNFINKNSIDLNLKSKRKGDSLINNKKKIFKINTLTNQITNLVTYQITNQLIIDTSFNINNKKRKLA